MQIFRVTCDHGFTEFFFERAEDAHALVGNFTVTSGMRVEVVDVIPSSLLTPAAPDSPIGFNGHGPSCACDNCKYKPDLPKPASR